MVLHLTNDLQAELQKIGSRVKLKTAAEAPFGVNFNFKGCAWAELDGRSIQASAFAASPDMRLEFEEKGITAGNTTSTSVAGMAVLVEKWLDKRCDIFDMAKEFAGIDISPRYRDLRNLSNQELLNLRWAELLAMIAKGTYKFRVDVFEAFRVHFSGLYPFFSLENLAFSDVLYSSPTFRTPFVFCDKDVIEVGYDRYNMKDKKNVRTSSIPEAIEYTRNLLPADVGEAVNPLKG